MDDDGWNMVNGSSPLSSNALDALERSADDGKRLDALDVVLALFLGEKSLGGGGPEGEGSLGIFAPRRAGGFLV